MISRNSACFLIHFRLLYLDFCTSDKLLEVFVQQSFLFQGQEHHFQWPLSTLSSWVLIIAGYLLLEPSWLLNKSIGSRHALGLLRLLLFMYLACLDYFFWFFNPVTVNLAPATNMCFRRGAAFQHRYSAKSIYSSDWTRSLLTEIFATELMMLIQLILI